MVAVHLLSVTNITARDAGPDGRGLMAGGEGSFGRRGMTSSFDGCPYLPRSRNRPSRPASTRSGMEARHWQRKWKRAAPAGFGA